MNCCNGCDKAEPEPEKDVNLLIDDVEREDTQTEMLMKYVVIFSFYLKRYYDTFFSQHQIVGRLFNT
jgi:hypothetical protein